MTDRRLHPVDDPPPAVCPVTWPLDDPNAEDRAAGHTHRCRRSPNHRASHHTCGCGAELAVVVDLADHDNRPYPNPLIHDLPDRHDSSRPMIGLDGPLQVCTMCGAVVALEWRNAHHSWHELLATTLDLLGTFAVPDWKPDPA